MTSIEWLITWMSKNQYFIGNDLLNAFEEAEKMHKEEIIKTWQEADQFPQSYLNAENYYNETYKKD